MIMGDMNAGGSSATIKVVNQVESELPKFKWLIGNEGGGGGVMIGYAPQSHLSVGDVLDVTHKPAAKSLFGIVLILNYSSFS